MHVSYGLKYALFVVTGCMFKSVRSSRSRLFESVKSVRSICAVWCRLVPSDVGLGLMKSAAVESSQLKSPKAGHTSSKANQDSTAGGGWWLAFDEPWPEIGLCLRPLSLVGLCLPV